MLLIEKEYSGLNRDINLNYLEKNWSLTDTDYNINYLLALEKIDSIKNIKLQYKKMLSQINSENINLNELLGKNRISDNLREIKTKINTLKSRFNTKYENVFNIRQDLVSKITTSYINDSKYDRPVYDNHSSVTGRTKISSGYNFLVMKKDDRKNITSKYKNGRVYEIDIVSLEPRIACKIMRNEEYDDIYDFISNNIVSNNHTRKNVKLGLISTLYGAKDETVKKLSGLDRNSVRRIKDWFRVKDLYTNLMNKYSLNQKITNFYGRNIYSNNAFINHFIQSSSVDSAMIGFNNFLKTFDEGVSLIAIIHDAIIIDVHPKHFHKVENTYYVNDHILGMNLPVKKELLS
jgi:hypothetical protein